jgi:hypothetical protein|tara:strand:- start:602 stop:883 length:282 start_codon:yes stop_codon:yes gene_type:complete
MNDETKEILLILQEECAEVSQAVSKCFRFGPDQVSPTSDKTNIQRLQEELGDLLAMIELLTDQNVGVSFAGMDVAIQAKFVKLKKWSTLTINK